MKQKLLLLEDVDVLGKSGDVVEVRAGYARNFLIPQRKALVAGKQTLQLQEKLQKERAQRAVIEKKEAEELSNRLAGVTLSIEVKVDPEGKMYGSVSALDIVKLLEEKEGIVIDKRAVQLKKPIKETGIFTISLKLKEDVQASFKLKVVAQEEKKS